MVNYGNVYCGGEVIMTYKEIEDILNLLRMCQFEKPIKKFSENYIKEFKQELIYISNKNKIRLAKSEDN